jgi:hypothetical protein
MKSPLEQDGPPNLCGFFWKKTPYGHTKGIRIEQPL